MADPRTATGRSDGARAPQSGRRCRQRQTGDGRRAEEEPQINSAEGAEARKHGRQIGLEWVVALVGLPGVVCA